MTFLDEAMSAARAAAGMRAGAVSVTELERRLEAARPTAPFRAALVGDGRPAVIAEVKRMSPSAGEIRPGASVAEVALSFQEAGAAAVSVLTSGFAFGGSPEDLSDAGTRCGLPLLCKDFISTSYQVLEARVMGASAVLLISEALDARALERLRVQARALGMDALVEAHTAAGLTRAIGTGAEVLGINNRDLETLEVDLATTERLAPMVPRGAVLVSESGIRTREDVLRAARAGADAVLVGEALMRAPEPGLRLKELTGREVGGDR